MEEKNGTQLKTVLCGVALVALASIPSAQAQTNECSSGGFEGGVCNRFDETHLTNKYQFGDNFIKFTVENLINPFDLNVELRSIDDTELDARVISPLAPVDCIKYFGATRNRSGYLRLLPRHQPAGLGRLLGRRDRPHLLGLPYSGRTQQRAALPGAARWSAARWQLHPGLQLLHEGHHRRRIRRRGLRYRRSRRGRQEQGLLRLRSGRSDRERLDGQGQDRAEEESRTMASCSI